MRRYIARYRWPSGVSVRVNHSFGKNPDGLAILGYVTAPKLELPEMKGAVVEYAECEFNHELPAHDQVALTAWRPL